MTHMILPHGTTSTKHVACGQLQPQRVLNESDDLIALLLVESGHPKLKHSHDQCND